MADLFDIAIAEKLAGGGGGGGSSDFNKAVVTVVNNNNGAIFNLMAIDLMNDPNMVIGFRFNAEAGVENPNEPYLYEPDTTNVDTFYIYHDCSMIGYSESLTSADWYTVTGDAEVTTMEGIPIILIYGDCTITIS